MLDSNSYEMLTVEDIAASSDVSPSTIYRYFHTKEGIFLWDEFDDIVLVEFASLLQQHPPVEAMKTAVDRILKNRFDLDSSRALARLRLIDRYQPLRNAMVVRVDQLRRTLAATIIDSGEQDLHAHVFAGAIVSSFLGVLELWFAGDGQESLREMFDEAMTLLAEGPAQMSNRSEL